MQTYYCLVLNQHLVVFGKGNQEDDGSDIFEAMDPLFPLRPLATNVKHAVR